MSRYFFHIEEGRVFQDADGTELPDHQAAAAEAVRVVSDLLKGNVDGVLASSSLRVSVTDKAGLMLFVVNVSCIRAPGFKR